MIPELGKIGLPVPLESHHPIPLPRPIPPHQSPTLPQVSPMPPPLFPPSPPSAVPLLLPRPCILTLLVSLPPPRSVSASPYQFFTVIRRVCCTLYASLKACTQLQIYTRRLFLVPSFSPLFPRGAPLAFYEATPDDMPLVRNRRPRGGWGLGGGGASSQPVWRQQPLAPLTHTQSKGSNFSAQ